MGGKRNKKQDDDLFDNEDYRDDQKQKYVSLKNQAKMEIAEANIKKDKNEDNDDNQEKKKKNKKKNKKAQEDDDAFGDDQVNTKKVEENKNDDQINEKDEIQR